MDEKVAGIGKLMIYQRIYSINRLFTVTKTLLPKLHCLISNSVRKFPL